MAAIIFDPKNELDKANQLYNDKKYADALTIAMQLIANKTEATAAMRLKSACHFNLNQFVDAEETLINIDEKIIDDILNLTQIYLKQKKIELAEKQAKQAVELAPAREDIAVILLNIYLDQGKNDAARELIKQILAKNPEHAEALYRQALLNNNKTEITNALKKMIAQQPLQFEPKLMLGQFFLNNADFKNAVYYFNQAMAMNNNNSLVSYYSAQLSYLMSQYTVAKNHYLAALKATPDVVEIHLGLAKNLLIMGEFAGGWQALDWHKKLATPPYIEALLEKSLYWYGQNLAKKHLLVYVPELPDMRFFLFYRYLYAIKQKNNKITLVAPAAQIPLLNSLKMVDEVISPTAAMPGKVDYVVSLLSIPTIKDFNYGVEYLAQFSENLSPIAMPEKINNIGLYWQQDQSAPYAAMNPIQSTMLTPLVQNMDAHFYCLHPELLDKTEITWCDENKINRPVQLNNPKDLLKLIHSLDLIITTDTEFAHFAASLNKPTWVMAPFYANWYLGTQAQQTPWYPSMKIFRQAKINSWEDIISHITNTLAQQKQRVNHMLFNTEFKLIQTLKDMNTAQKFKESLPLAKQGVLDYPKQAIIWFFLGAAAAVLKLNQLALASLLESQRLDSKNYDICTNLGTVYYRLNDIDNACKSFERAVELAPNNPDTVKNLAITYFEIGRFEQALMLYRKALTLKDSIENHFGYSLQLLSLKQYEEGWREYEYRLKIPQHNYNSLAVNSPLWDGSNLDNKSIFIVSEQGLGDNIQFLRFLPLLKQHYNCRLILGCSKNMLRLVKQFEDVDQVICENERIPTHHFHLPIMSLAMHFKIYQQSQFMSDKPYLVPHPVLKNFWQQYFAKNKKINVGFCWSGSASHMHNERRNCQLFDFIKLLKNDNIVLYSLQKNITASEKELLSVSNIDDLGEQFDDLADTAAAISQLDLIISIDTALAHLAGALGKQTWLLLPYYTEWRHPRDVTYSPWYSQVKLYQQTIAGDWRDIFARVENDLLAIPKK